MYPGRNNKDKLPKFGCTASKIFILNIALMFVFKCFIRDKTKIFSKIKELTKFMVFLLSMLLNPVVNLYLTSIYKM
jgi:hypothetical protein